MSQERSYHELHTINPNELKAVNDYLKRICSEIEAEIAANGNGFWHKQNPRPALLCHYSLLTLARRQRSKPTQTELQYWIEYKDREFGHMEKIALGAISIARQVYGRRVPIAQMKGASGLY